MDNPELEQASSSRYHEGDAVTDSPLPPYADDPPAYTTGEPVGPSPYERLPLAFNLYYKKWTVKTYQLGEHEDQPLYTITSVTDFAQKKPMVILHEGGDPKGPIISTVTKDSMMNAHTNITVPGRPGSADDTITEHLRSDMFTGSNHLSFSFSFNVCRDKDIHREAFEWRPTRGAEVRALDKWSWGWKLVRLGKTTGSGGSRSVRSVGETSDGKEIVAVWAAKTTFTTSKLGKFHFLGAGMTGELGEEWAFMAVMSALRLWNYLAGTLTSGY
ncbi:MAG: hypothetical protein M1816_007041 [Peltula sp. TS41687]|nr:MAG: hypothetical protein M1816_007041 [Peltula sp. TS41687]